MTTPVHPETAEGAQGRVGVCQQCQRWIRLRKDGMVRQHGAKLQHVWPPQTCVGSGAHPKATS